MTEDTALELRQFDSYDEYVRLQSETNRQKLGHIWVTGSELQTVAAHISRNIPAPKFGICHGVRNGFEVRCLRELLQCQVIGTEISDSATQFENVIQWDFHEVKDEWIKSIDFIYSNSWDHSFDPELMLERWLSCLAPGGYCYLEWSRNHMPKSVYGADCFGIDYSEMLDWLKDKCTVRTTLKVNRGSLLRQPARWAKDLLQPIRVIVIQPK
jgi:hypothetical protein